MSWVIKPIPEIIIVVQRLIGVFDQAKEVRVTMREEYFFKGKVKWGPLFRGQVKGQAEIVASSSEASSENTITSLLFFVLLHTSKERV